MLNRLIKKERGSTHLGPGPSSDSGSGRPLLLLLLLVVPLGEIIPRCCWRRRARRWRWLWWRRTRWLWWRRTGVPLCALGLGAGLLGPASSPLTLLGAGLLGPNEGGGGPKRTIHRRGAADVSFPPPTPRRRLGWRSCLQPLCPCPRVRGPRWGLGKLWRGRWGPRQQSRGLQPVHRRFGSHDWGPDRRSGEPRRRARRESAAWPKSPSSTLRHRKVQGCPRGGLETQGRRTHQ
jgi:hypothetical protein